MAADHALRRELSRRIRDDLIQPRHRPGRPRGTHRRRHPGQPRRPDHLHPATTTPSRRASPAGRWPTATCSASRPSPADGLIVRRALDADPRTGQRRWTDRHFLFASYENSELGYAVTDHTAQGRTVHTGLAVITGTEDRQHAYVALTRGTDVNLAYVFTLSPKLADPVPGPRPAPELARYDRLTAGRRRPARPQRPRPGRRSTVLSGVLDRDGQQLSATQTRHQALSDADHLALLHAIWTAETTPARHQRYQDLLLAALPPGYRSRTRPPGQMAVADPARRRTRRPGRRAGPGRRDRRAGPGRRPRHPQPSSTPASATALGSLRPAPARPVVRAAPRHRRPRTPRLRRRRSPR